MVSDSAESYDDPDDRNTEEDAEKEADNYSSVEASVAGSDEEDAAYEIWKSNSQYLYDLLIHHHTQWPCLSCSWGPVSDDKNTSSTAPLSQILYSTSHTDGSFTSDDRRWKKTPESISTSMVELTRQRGTQAWFIGKFSESQKSRNIVNVRSIIHPGIISRVLSIPHTMWIISHSNQQNVYFWRSCNKGCRAIRDNLEATIPDIT
ncbi:hypothetical protein JH06_1470 [Blastocystis sp. subtype 4]|uniref:hypothetical protein n=1 Tax=Blastocystis sp. subtype 4 TaxID=944170 RepID=UPI000711A069|nr:hypothetical protein JH06_1470 [Blastocystis sp. subtype 4]KNB45175.1 hypothetical protein JH06_1470 [Blastocystis sp. subtype 4]|eukprot:XP_014528618.1 hypothetical protein JH06_1470 [Blastocystis sp. subtype 4]